MLAVCTLSPLLPKTYENVGVSLFMLPSTYPEYSWLPTAQNSLISNTREEHIFKLNISNT